MTMVWQQHNEGETQPPATCHDISIPLHIILQSLNRPPHNLLDASSWCAATDTEKHAPSSHIHTTCLYNTTINYNTTIYTHDSVNGGRLIPHQHRIQSGISSPTPQPKSCFYSKGIGQNSSVHASECKHFSIAYKKHICTSGWPLDVSCHPPL